MSDDDVACAVSPFRKRGVLVVEIRCEAFVPGPPHHPRDWLCIRKERQN
jgi:hypothetical protein